MFVCVCVCVCVYVCVCVCLCVCMCMFVCVCMFVCAHICIHMCVYMCLSIFMCTCVNAISICDGFANLQVRRLSSTVGSYWDVHAWEDPYTEDLTDPNIQSSSVAEGS